MKEVSVYTCCEEVVGFAFSIFRAGFIYCYLSVFFYHVLIFICLFCCWMLVMVLEYFRWDFFGGSFGTFWMVQAGEPEYL